LERSNDEDAKLHAQSETDTCVGSFMEPDGDENDEKNDRPGNGAADEGKLLRVSPTRVENDAAPNAGECQPGYQKVEKGAGAVALTVSPRVGLNGLGSRAREDDQTENANREKEDLEKKIASPEVVAAGGPERQTRRNENSSGDNHEDAGRNRPAPRRAASMLQCPPCCAIGDCHEQGDDADKIAENEKGDGRELPVSSREPRTGLRMLMHPDESPRHEDGDDEGDEREIAEANTQEYSEALHGGSFHRGAGDAGVRLFVTISQKDGAWGDVRDGGWL